MPTIRKMKEEEHKKIIEEQNKVAEETSDEDIDKIAELLKKVLDIYISKQGTYKPGYWKRINEDKISNSIKCIESLLDYYNKFDSLTPAQIILARKMIKNGFILL